VSKAKRDVFVEIAPDVYAVAHRLVDGKNAIVFAGRGALAVDACNYADEGEAMAAFIRLHGDEPDRLALTHAHGDHVLGSGAFRGAEVYAHRGAPATIARHLSTWATRYFEGSIEAAEAAITRPTVLFSDELRIELGGKTARMFSTPGHCPDAACVLLEEDRVLCGGDTVVTGIVPAIQDGDSRLMEATLRGLASLDAQVLVPGHGAVLHGRATIREHLLWMASYLARIRAFADDALGAGEPAAHLTEAANYAEFVGERLPLEPHGMLRRHRLVVSKIVDEQLEAMRVAQPRQPEGIQPR
jgi:glyoxylase-like metal-dependent hydrolase (beta-lactamase superfamily II)